MLYKVENTKQLGAIAKCVRQDQSLDQFTAGQLSGNGITFISQFENGKTGVELGRVLNLFDQLGIEIHLDLPPNMTKKSLEKIVRYLNKIDAEVNKGE